METPEELVTVDPDEIAMVDVILVVPIVNGRSRKTFRKQYRKLFNNESVIGTRITM